MTTDRNFELKVGLFVGIGIVLFFMIVFSVGDITFVRQGYHAHTSFDFVDGLNESAPVRYAGVTVGHVKDIVIYRDEMAEKTKVRVSLWINDTKLGIEKDAIATINTLGLLGEKYIEIFPGTVTSGIVRDGDALEGKDPIVIRSLTGTLSQLADSANEVMTRIKKGEGTIGKLFMDDTLYTNLEEFVEDIKENPWKLLHKPRMTR